MYGEHVPTRNLVKAKKFPKKSLCVQPSRNSFLNPQGPEVRRRPPATQRATPEFRLSPYADLRVQAPGMGGEGVGGRADGKPITCLLMPQKKPFGSRCFLNKEGCFCVLHAPLNPRASKTRMRRWKKIVLFYTGEKMPVRTAQHNCGRGP